MILGRAVNRSNKSSGNCPNDFAGGRWQKEWSTNFTGESYLGGGFYKYNTWKYNVISILDISWYFHIVSPLIPKMTTFDSKLQEKSFKNTQIFRLREDCASTVRHSSMQIHLLVWTKTSIFRKFFFHMFESLPKKHQMHEPYSFVEGLPPKTTLCWDWSVESGRNQAPLFLSGPPEVGVWVGLVVSGGVPCQVVGFETGGLGA